MLLLYVNGTLQAHVLRIVKIVMGLLFGVVFGIALIDKNVSLLKTQIASNIFLLL